MRRRACLLLVAGCSAAGCLRPLLTDEALDAGGDGTSVADADGDTSEGGTTDAAQTEGGADPACHPSYVPCLPIVDDLDCDEIAGPVMVVDVDEYGLDADLDGIGCEG